MKPWADQIRDASRRVVAALKELSSHHLYRDVLPRAHQPAVEPILGRYEAFLGLTLPPSYRTFLSMHDGYDWLAFPGHMLSVRDVMPGGEYWQDIRTWKLGMANAGLSEALDGVVIAYLDQPNNWAYLDPGHLSGDGEMNVVLHVPGVDPTVYGNVVEFLDSSEERARLALSWESRS